MYICPLCEKKYEQAPEQCVQCKRPLILNKRFRIETSIEAGPFGEDFDVVDLKKGEEPAILRELRIKRADLSARGADVQRYRDNVKRLGGLKYEGKKVLIDAFEVETTNSICYYQALDADAWAGLGDELYLGAGGGGGSNDGGLPAIEGRELDPELAAMLAKLDGGADQGKKPSKSAKPAPALDDDDNGALVKAKGGALAKTSGEPSAIATKAKVVIVGGAVAIVLAIILALFLL